MGTAENRPLNQEFRRVNQRYSDTNGKSIKARAAETLPGDVAAFLAAGGRIDVLPGFQGIAPLPRRKEPTPKAAQAPRLKRTAGQDDPEWRAAPGYPAYAVSRDGRIKGLRYGVIIQPRPSGKVRIYRDRAAEDVCPHQLARMVWGE